MCFSAPHIVQWCRCSNQGRSKSGAANNHRSADGRGDSGVFLLGRPAALQVPVLRTRREVQRRQLSALRQRHEVSSSRGARGGAAGGGGSASYSAPAGRRPFLADLSAAAARRKKVCVCVFELTGRRT